MLIAAVPYLAPLALIIATLCAFRGPALRPTKALRLIEGMALFALMGAVFATGLLILMGPMTSGLVGASGLGFSVRLDAVSAVMLLLVSFVGWVVVRFAATYRR